jgi:hypothetical protein
VVRSGVMSVKKALMIPCLKKRIMTTTVSEITHFFLLLIKKS